MGSLSACSLSASVSSAPLAFAQYHSAAVQRAGWAPLPVPQRQCRRRAQQLRTAASSSGGNGASPPPPRPEEQPQNIGDSDAVFLVKLAAVSFALGGAVKYGSLLISLPFEPNAAAALAFVFGPPLVWGTLKLAQQK